MDIIIVIALIALLAAALEPAHRRTRGLPRAPMGADADVDLDTRIVLHDAFPQRW
ncbi:hypothetical protein [Intrasporangium flavum]|uniref:hypothetical protein n=1 Tax=Intrasporangium flavum TaxID=1428657 RepID=UPI001A9593CB|nr:hypothetical protein [Intrasporangium flavum]